MNIKSATRGIIASLLIALSSACSSGGQEVQQELATTTTASQATTTTTIDPAVLLQEERERFLTELFMNNTRGFEDTDLVGFLSLEEIGGVLRQSELSGKLKYGAVGESILYQSQREICDDWLVEDLVATLQPSKSVSRSYISDFRGTDATNEAIFLIATMTVFEVSDPGLLGGLEAQVVDGLAASGGRCDTSARYYSFFSDFTKFYQSDTQQWWTDEQATNNGIEYDDLRLKYSTSFTASNLDRFTNYPGFFIAQPAAENSDRSLRVYSFTPIPNLGRMVLLDLNFRLNYTDENSISPVDFITKTSPVLGDIRYEMLNKFFGALPQ